MRMMLVAIFCAAMTGCAAGGAWNVERDCRAQGYAPGEEAWLKCTTAGENWPAAERELYD